MLTKYSRRIPNVVTTSTAVTSLLCWLVASGLYCTAQLQIQNSLSQQLFLNLSADAIAAPLVVILIERISIRRTRALNAPLEDTALMVLKGAIGSIASMMVFACSTKDSAAILNLYSTKEGSGEKGHAYVTHSYVDYLKRLTIEDLSTLQYKHQDIEMLGSHLALRVAQFDDLLRLYSFNAETRVALIKLRNALEFGRDTIKGIGLHYSMTRRASATFTPITINAWQGIVSEAEAFINKFEPYP